MQIIHLDEEDDIVSICDRLAWVKEEPRVALVLARRGRRQAPQLLEWLDLVRLRRCADALRLEVGLVTVDRAVGGQARVLGFPVFTTVAAAESSRRGWWRGRGRRHATRPGATVRLGEAGSLKSLPDDADRREMYRRMTPRAGWQRWLLRYLGILLFFLALTAFFVGVAYAVPGATVTLHPQVEALQVSRQIVADPRLETISSSGASVPARLLAVDVVWQAEAETTGVVEVPDAPAHGTVVFVNRLEQPVTVPAGTRVSTSAGERLIFQTVEPVEVPGVVGATAEATVVALEAGPSGNVRANLINRVEGSLSLPLRVRNLEPTEGGGSRTVAAVSRQDQERLRAQVLQHLQAVAIAEMEELLAEGEFLAHDSLRVIEVYEETFSHFPGEPADRLALEMRAEMHGTAVDASQANDLVYERLTAAMRPGFELVPETLHFYSDEVLGVDGDGRVTFLMVGEARMSASLEVDEALARVAGQETGLALAYLYERLPLRQYPAVRIWPNWFGRLPYLPVRIQTRVETGVQPERGGSVGES